ncbi:MAG: DUF6515 family protein, partial [Planctomycetota bacterium]
MKHRILLVVLLVLGTSAPAVAFRGGHMRMRRGGFHHGGHHHHSFHHHHSHAHHHRHSMHRHHAHHMHHVMHHHWWHVRLRRIIFGTWLLTRPRHTTVVYVDTAPYYYSTDDGTYYSKKGDAYVNIPPPVGATVKSLPDGAAEVKHDGNTYHYYVGAWYLKADDGGYQVVAAPVGATVPYKPKGAARKKVDGKTYWVYANAYYDAKFVDGLTLYQVAAPPTVKVPGVVGKLPDDRVTVKHDDKTFYFADGDWYVDSEAGYKKV